MKKNRKKGFTLVELLVVLVILAILAAALIPSFMGFIDHAKQSALNEECRICVTSAQILLHEAYGSGKDLTPDAEAVKKLADVKGAVSAIQIDSEQRTVSHLTYTKDGISVTYCAFPDSCPDHEEIFNYNTGSSSGESQISAGIVLTDSAGKTYTLYPNTDFAEAKALIAGDGWEVTGGCVVSDETGVYVCQSWWFKVKKPGNTTVTLAELAEESPDRFLKITSASKIWTQADLVDQDTDPKWSSKPAAGDLSYYNGSFYVATSGVGRWAIPPGGWIAIPQP